MTIRIHIMIVFLFISAFSFNSEAQSTNKNVEVITKKQKKKQKKKRKQKVKLPNIDLTHWKVTIPKGVNGKPINVGPPDIANYATNTDLKPYMYNDSIRGAIVFNAYPSNATTANSKYSRSELREQMVPGSNNTNWTFKDGGTLKGKLQIADISRDKKGKYHKTIVMQIHGRLTNKQRDLIGAKDNNAPPMLKIYWKNGKIRVKTKVLKHVNMSNNEVLLTESWDDDKGFTFEQEVGFRKFTLEVKVSNGKMVVILNNNEFKVYENIHIRKWGVFENYFKAGNYFQTRDKNSFAKVRYYDLEVSH